MSFKLICHPDTPATAELSISVDVVRARPDTLYLRYIVDGDLDRVVLPPMKAGARTDGLWQSTCFEAFLRVPEQAGYVELNFAPSSDWAAYRFDDYRDGMRDAEAGVEVGRYGGIIQVLVDLSTQPDLHGSDWALGLTAVIEEKDGTKSYWALKHADGSPDFHAGDCFALTVPAPEAS